MTIKYYAHPASEKIIVERNLSEEKILAWEIYPESRLGYKGGNLSIKFDTSHLTIVTNEGGIYPPISQILNYAEVLLYLKKKFSHLEKLNNKSTSEIQKISPERKNVFKRIFGFNK